MIKLSSKVESGEAEEDVTVQIVFDDTKNGMATKVARLK